MGLIILLLWAIGAWYLLCDNIDLLGELPAWRAVVSTVLLIAFTPAFFLSDLGEVLLDILASEEDT